MLDVAELTCVDGSIITLTRFAVALAIIRRSRLTCSIAAIVMMIKYHRRYLGLKRTVALRGLLIPHVTVADAGAHNKVRGNRHFGD